MVPKKIGDVTITAAQSGNEAVSDSCVIHVVAEKRIDSSPVSYTHLEVRSNLLEGQGFLLDRGTYTIYINNTSVVLPGNQGKLLEALLAGGGDLVTAEQLCRALWDTAEFIDENALQVNLTRLKKTMANLGMKQKVAAVRGSGYRLETEDTL